MLFIALAESSNKDVIFPREMSDLNEPPLLLVAGHCLPESSVWRSWSWRDSSISQDHDINHLVRWEERSDGASGCSHSEDPAFSSSRTLGHYWEKGDWEGKHCAHFRGEKSNRPVIYCERFDNSPEIPASPREQEIKHIQWRVWED